MIRQEENSGFKKFMKEFGPEIKFVVIFATGIVLAFLAINNEFTARTVIHQITVAEAWVAGQILEVMGYPNKQDGVMLMGEAGNSFRMEVRNNCNGVFESIIFLMAFVAIQVPWRRKIGWMLAGFTVFHIINEARLVSLFIIGSNYSHDTFVFFHETFWNYTIVIFTLMIFLFCVHRISKTPVMEQQTRAA